MYSLPISFLSLCWSDYREIMSGRFWHRCEDWRQKYQQSLLCWWYNFISRNRGWSETPYKNNSRESEKMGLQLNIKKTKIMSTARHIKMYVTINGEEIECVKEFYFLGSMIDQTGDCTPEIKHWISLGHIAMLSMQQIWKSKDINLTTKCRLVQTIVFPISIYGCESWTVKKTDRRG